MKQIARIIPIILILIIGILLVSSQIGHSDTKKELLIHKYVLHEIALKSDRDRQIAEEAITVLTKTAKNMSEEEVSEILIDLKNAK